VENDVVLPAGPGVSRKHAEIFCRLSASGEQQYFLRDISRYGTWISQTNGWQQVTQQEVAIPSGSKIKFGTMENMPLEFLVSHG
jgi:pSer/pThr/pTyr-binding forkhead associated (FHA) protein